jgi:hypothetical protein
MAIVDLVAHLDESGTHGGTRLTVMAGWIARAGRWAEFDGKWKNLLIRQRLPYIHAKDLTQGTGHFKDKIRWPMPKRVALASEASSLAHEHAVFGLVTLLNTTDYDVHYIGNDRKLRKHRGPLDSKYGVCSRICISLLARLTQQYFADDAILTLVLEAGAKNQGAAQTILSDMYRIAPDIAKFINPVIGYALKEKSPGVQAADLLAYPAYGLERDGLAETESFVAGLPETLPGETTTFRVPIVPDTLRDIKEGQAALRATRRLLGPHWGHLDGFPRGWTTKALRSAEGFLLMPPAPPLPLPVDALDPEIPEPAHCARLRCL